MLVGGRLIDDGPGGQVLPSALAPVVLYAREAAPDAIVARAFVREALPMTPMATPTSAVFKAGASLTPSPIMQTRFSFFNLTMCFTLSSGKVILAVKLVFTFSTLISVATPEESRNDRGQRKS